MNSKTAEATGDKITKIWNNLQQNNLETVTNEHDKELPKEWYIARRKTENFWWPEINTDVIFIK